MDASGKLAAHLKNYRLPIGKVVDFDARTDKLLGINLTAANTELSPQLFGNPQAFTTWVDEKMSAGNYRYGTGGYMENRTIYNSRGLFEGEGEPRSLHLGVDIWAGAGTPVYTPLEGIIHSFNDNAGYGDYGPTIILQHDINGLTLYSLYGHLRRQDLQGLSVGQPVHTNKQIGGFGDIDENGNWPPHLHFQLMLDMEGKHGDYPGVGYPAKKENYLQNIPDPNLLLRFPAKNYG